MNGGQTDGRIHGRMGGRIEHRTYWMMEWRAVEKAAGWREGWWSKGRTGGQDVGKGAKAQLMEQRSTGVKDGKAEGQICGLEDG